MVAADRTPQENAATLQRYASVVSARVMAKQEPLHCRVAAFRWIFDVIEAKTDVTYTLRVSKTLRGPKMSVVRVVQEQVFGNEGCVADGSNSCGRDFKLGEDVWALRRLNSGEFERAGLCDERRVREILNV
jgi:hypothetical protein